MADESISADELLTAIQEVTDTADRLLAERLTDLLATAPPVSSADWHRSRLSALS